MNHAGNLVVAGYDFRLTPDLDGFLSDSARAERSGNPSPGSVAELADLAAVASARGMWLTLVAMTVASSMILVDQTAVPLASPDVVQGLGGNIADGQWILTANILPLAAFMVLGGRLGDLFGLRRVFLCGAVAFAISTALASAAQDMVWVIGMRAVQGTSAALMLQTAVAITSAVWPKERRGYALGILAGGRLSSLRLDRFSAGS